MRMLFWNDEDIFATSAKAPGPKNEKEDFGFLWTVSKADASENDGKESLISFVLVFMILSF